MHGDGPGPTQVRRLGITPLEMPVTVPVDSFHAEGTKGCQMTTALAICGTIGGGESRG
jgi:hypothetical protein